MSVCVLVLHDCDFSWNKWRKSVNLILNFIIPRLSSDRTGHHKRTVLKNSLMVICLTLNCCFLVSYTDPDDPREETSILNNVQSSLGTTWYKARRFYFWNQAGCMQILKLHWDMFLKICRLLYLILILKETQIKLVERVLVFCK